MCVCVVKDKMSGTGILAAFSVAAASVVFDRHFTLVLIVVHILLVELGNFEGFEERHIALTCGTFTGTDLVSTGFVSGESISSADFSNKFLCASHASSPCLTGKINIIYRFATWLIVQFESLADTSVTVELINA